MSVNLGSIFYQLGVNTSGLNKASSKVRTFQRTTEKSFNSIDRVASNLKSTIATVITIEGTRRVLMMADGYTRLGDRMRAVMGDAVAAQVAFRKLEKISEKTGASLNDTIGSFQKFYLVKEAVGATTDEMVDLTDTLVKYGAVSGATTAGMSSAMLQFSQGLSTGTFQAQELISVMEGLPGINVEIAKGMGITNAEFVNLKREGKVLSEDVFRALLNRSDEISKKFEDMDMNLQRGGSRLALGFTQGLGAINESTELTKTLGKYLFTAGEHASDMHIYLQATINVIKDMDKKTLSWGDSVGKAVVALIGMKVVLAGIATVLSVMTKANIFLLLATGALALLDHFVGLDKVGRIIVQIFKEFYEFGKKAFDYILEKAEALKGPLDNIIESFKKIDLGILNGAIKKTAVNFAQLNPVLSIAADAITTLDGKTLDNLESKTEDSASGIEKSLKRITDAGKGIDTGSTDGGGGTIEQPKDNSLSFFEQIQKEILQLQEDKDKEQLRKQIETDKKIEAQAKKSSYARLKIDEWRNGIKKTLDDKHTKDDLDRMGRGFRSQIDMAGQHSKEFAALSKGIALFEIAVKTPQAIASAFTWGSTVGGTPLGLSMGAAAGAAMAVQAGAVMSANYTPRAVGGDVSPNGLYKVNENGPELFSFGGDDYLATGNSRGKITPNPSEGRGPSGTNVTVNVYPIEGQEARIEENDDGEGGINLDIIMEQVDGYIAEGISNGDSKTGAAMSSVYGLNSAVGGAF